MTDLQSQADGQSVVDDNALFDEGISEIIAAHGGDARAAVRALLEQISYLEMARNRMAALVSYGYSRGKAH